MLTSRPAETSSATRRPASAASPWRGCCTRTPSAPARPTPAARPALPAEGQVRRADLLPGGVSHVDTFDYKPDLAKHDGQELSGKGKIDTFFGQPGRLLKSPFAFKQYGQCGQWVSGLLPEPGRVRGRPDVPPGDGRQELQPHAGRVPDEHRLHDERLPVHGGVGVLRPRHGEPGPAGLRGAARPARSAGRRRHQLDRPASCPPRTRASPSAPPATRSPTCSRPRTPDPRRAARPAPTCSPR